MKKLGKYKVTKKQASNKKPANKPVKESFPHFRYYMKSGHPALITAEHSSDEYKYCSCERGTNERMNREVRRKFPKSTNFKNVSATEVQKVEDWLNNYPRGVLDYATPNEVYNSLMATI